MATTTADSGARSGISPGFLLLLVVLAALIALGLAGKAATAGYQCHNVRVGDSVVCQ